MSRRLAGALACVALLGGCQAPQLAPELRGQAPRTVAVPRSAARSLGTIAGRPLRAEELLIELHGLLGRDFLLVLDRTVSSKLAEAEAARLGLVLKPQAIEASFQSARSTLLGEFARAFPGDDYAAVVERELGVAAAVHNERLRAAAEREILTERVVRATTLAQESAAIRLIVVTDEREALDLSARLREGVEFARLASEHSQDESRKAGGFVPYLVRDDRTPLSRAAFLLSVGETTGPFKLNGRWVILKLEEKRQPIPGPWGQVGAAVEASLLSDPVVQAEFLFWQLQAEKLYEIELTPLTELLGLSTPISESADDEQFTIGGDLPAQED